MLGAVSGLKDRIVALVMYRNPVRSLVALVAWLTSVSNGARAVAWLWLLAALDLRDTLAGVREDDKAKQGHNIVPRVARPQFPMLAWAKAIATGTKSKPHPTSDEEFQAAKKSARGDAESVAIELMLEEWRASGRVKVVEEEDEEEDVVDEDDYKSKKPMKRFRSIHILKPFLEPVQRLLLGLLLPLRALAALANGRADPVATATLAAACLAVGLGTMIYAPIIHR